MRISDLLAIDDLRLRLLTGDPAREFGTVHITDLPEPGRYLSGGELVLTGLMWWHAPEDSARFVAALAESGVAALGAGQAWLGHVPDDLVAACAHAGLPLVEVPVEVSFRTLAETVVPRLAGDMRDALGRHRRLVAAIAEGADLRELFELTAAELGVTGAVVSASGEVIVGAADDPVGLAKAYLTAPRLPVRVGGHTIFAVGRGHRAAGWVLACDGDLMDRADLGYELAACVGLERSRVEEGRRVERRLTEQLIVAALGEAGVAELDARLRTCGVDAAEPYAIVNVTAPRPGATRGPDPATLGGQAVEELLGRQVVAAAGADGAVAVVPLRACTPAELADRLRAGAAVLAALPGTRLCVGLSGALTGAAAVKGGVEEAGHARRLAETRGGGVVTSDEIYTHALLLATVPGDVRRSFAARLLSPLLDYDRRHQSELVRTLGIYLDCAGSWNACAEQLHVHVNTVRYRVRRIEELTGRDLSTMADRVDFFLALRDTAPPR
ncbi:DNA-binding PucR family transcriptional regulator [Nonomuraea thailandensis]|uniref:DNA-binding PucR family transcriptional regulator n=1 Tax=Nonomuraea thailandensis TaxID=1188745 RepID=A0A9X2K4B6_9ACTN|nr:PucR family transcriptional regulator [Nonomuraea thailandensis]MCP2359888.1 DNA-binding PucR family transcriptional regulator [Nonomuraea thailandensis]